MNNKVFLSLGTNLGDRTANLSSALKAIEKIGKIIKISSVYESESWGYKSADSFMNMCVEISTELTPDELLKELKLIEMNMGRIRSNFDSYEDRIIDIDIILFSDKVISNDFVKIPHPLYANRLFVLLPLNEIARNAVDPERLVTVGQILKSCKDVSEITQIANLPFVSNKIQ